MGINLVLSLLLPLSGFLTELCKDFPIVAEQMMKNPIESLFCRRVNFDQDDDGLNNAINPGMYLVSRTSVGLQYSIMIVFSYGVYKVQIFIQMTTKEFAFRVQYGQGVWSELTYLNGNQ